MRYKFVGTVEVREGLVTSVGKGEVESYVSEGFSQNSAVKLLDVSATPMTYQPPRMVHRALDRQVLAVAVPGAIGDWAVYVGAVTGHSHEREAAEVASEGAKQTRAVAAFLFPQFNPDLYRD
jgi:hypothetical protein